MSGTWPWQPGWYWWRRKTINAWEPVLVEAGTEGLVSCSRTGDVILNPFTGGLVGNWGPPIVSPPSKPKASFIEFVGGETIPGGKTKIWEVRAKNAEALGEVKWYAPWRCYSFFPRPSTLYDKQCLRDIADFCKNETLAQRTKKRATG